jgi:hypothetical protein
VSGSVGARDSGAPDAEVSETAKRRGLVAGVESSPGSPTLTGSEVLRKTGDPLTDALTDIRRGVTVDEAAIRYGIPVERLARLSGKVAALIPEDDMFAPKPVEKR